MGDISDYYRDQQLDEEFKHFHHNHKPSNKEYIWLSANGTEYKVKEMTNSHIQNTLRCLEEGRIPFNTDYELNLCISVLKKECKNRGLKELKLRIDLNCDASEIDIY
ncbi:MAG: hypothetical protein GY775_14625 [Candidatus Scalindua sp.]|nr:hypothetical protein [Candidatus Scalindua sp.]